jgi:molybdenum cofactor cytidylyltransferase
MSSVMKIVGLLLAAGLSRRFGSNKLLFNIQNEPLVRRTARCLLGAGVAELIVIVGHQSDQVAEVLADLPLRCEINQQYQLGRMHSVHTGWTHVPDNADGVLICPADLFCLEITDVQQVISAFYENKSLIIPHFNQQRGHPIIIPANYKKDILDYLPRGGCRAFISDHPQLVQHLEINSPNIIIDLDMPLK